MWCARAHTPHRVVMVVVWWWWVWGWCSMVRACVRETPSGLGVAGPEPRTLRRRLPFNRHDAVVARGGDEDDGRMRAGEGENTTATTAVIGNDSQCPPCPACTPCEAVYTIRNKGPCQATDVVLVSMVALVVALLIALLLTTFLRNRRKAAPSSDSVDAPPASSSSHAAKEGRPTPQAPKTKKRRRRRLGSLMHRSLASVRGGSDRSVRSGWKWRRQPRWEDTTEEEVFAMESDGRYARMSAQSNQQRADVPEEYEPPMVVPTPTLLAMEPTDRGTDASIGMSPTMETTTEATGTSSFGRSSLPSSLLLPPPTKATAVSGDDANRQQMETSSPSTDRRDHLSPPEASTRNREAIDPIGRNTAANHRTGEGPSDPPQQYSPISHDAETQELLRRRMPGERRSAADGWRSTNVEPHGDVEQTSPYPSSDV